MAQAQKKLSTKSQWSCKEDISQRNNQEVIGNAQHYTTTTMFYCGHGEQCWVSVKFSTLYKTWFKNQRIFSIFVDSDMPFIKLQTGFHMAYTTICRVS